MSMHSAGGGQDDWQIYRPDHRERTAWKPLKLPPWRPRRAEQALAEEMDAQREPVSVVTRERGSTYRSNEEICRMVNAALYLRRPLLVTGEPGTGKSTLIDSVACDLGLGEPLRWAVNSRSTLRDALYTYDAIGRAQRQTQAGSPEQHLEVGDFIELGPIGTAMLPALRPRALLIDEIDKADMDLPNDLLNILEEAYFHIPELSRLPVDDMWVRTYGGQQQVKIVRGKVESFEFPFVVMTSNDERDFPPPFLRRCLRFKMPDPCKEDGRLEKIVSVHLGDEMMEKGKWLIDAFVARASDGETRATDQLLNAIQMVLGPGSMEEKDSTELVNHLMAGLGRKRE